MGSFSIWHWVIVLAVVVLVFGTKKLRNFGGDLGAAVRGFKQGVKDSDKPTLDEPIVETTAKEKTTPDKETQTH